jgi:hypothetical protein
MADEYEDYAVGDDLFDDREEYDDQNEGQDEDGPEGGADFEIEDEEGPLEDNAHDDVQQDELELDKEEYEHKQYVVEATANQSWAEGYLLDKNLIYNIPLVVLDDAETRAIFSKQMHDIVHIWKEYPTSVLVTTIPNIRGTPHFAPLLSLGGDQIVFVENLVNQAALNVYTGIVNVKRKGKIVFLLDWNSESQFNELYKVIDQNPVLLRNVLHLFIVNSSEDAGGIVNVTENMYNEVNPDYTTNRFLLSKLFPTYQLKTDQFNYRLRIQTREQAIKIGFVYKLTNVNKTKIIVPREIVKKILFTAQIWEGEEQSEFGIARLLHLLHNSTSRTKQHWLREMSLLPSAPSPNLTIKRGSLFNGIVERIADNSLLAQQLSSSVMVYEEYVRELFLSNSSYSARDGESYSRNINSMIKEKIIEAAKLFFRNLLTSDILNVKEELVALYKKNPRKPFYFPNIYHYNEVIYQALQDYTNFLKIYKNTKFAHAKLLTDSLGIALQDVIENMLQISPYSELIVTDTIIAKMIEVAPKVAVFVENGMKKQTLLDIIQCILECNKISLLVVPKSIVNILLEKLPKSSMNALKNLDDDTYAEVLTVLYQYSYYCYQTNKMLLQKKEQKEYFEADIAAQMLSISNWLEVRSSQLSSLFPTHGYDGCIVESIFEFMILYLDVKNSTILDDNLCRTLTNAVSTYMGLEMALLEEKVPWINDILVKSFCKQNMVSVTITVASQIADLLCYIIGLYNKGPAANKPKIHKFTRVFLGRNNIMLEKSVHEPPHLYAEYNLTSLLEEQRNLRNDSSLPQAALPNMKELIAEQGFLCKTISELENMGNDRVYQRELFTYVNRMNLIKHILIGTRDMIRMPMVEFTESILSRKDQAKSPVEKQYKLFDLHQRRHLLFSSNEEITKLHLELLQNIKLEVQALPIGRLLNERVIMVLLQSMYRYDVHHLLLFYLLIKRGSSVHASSMMFNEEQHIFLQDLMEHLEWLTKIKYLEESNDFYKKFSNFFTKTDHDATVFLHHHPRYHIVHELDSYDPSPLSVWIESQIKTRMKDMNTLLTDTDSAIYKLFRQQSIAFSSQLWEYQELMFNQTLFTNETQRASSLRHVKELIPQLENIIGQLEPSHPLFTFAYELRMNAITRWTLLNSPEIISNNQTPETTVTVTDVEMVVKMLSYYIYGKLSNVLTTLLFVKPFENAITLTRNDPSEIKSIFNSVPEGETQAILLIMESLVDKYFHTLRLKNGFNMLVKMIKSM